MMRHVKEQDETRRWKLQTIKSHYLEIISRIFVSRSILYSTLHQDFTIQILSSMAINVKLRIFMIFHNQTMQSYDSFTKDLDKTLENRETSKLVRIQKIDRLFRKKSLINTWCHPTKPTKFHRNSQQPKSVQTHHARGRLGLVLRKWWKLTPKTSLSIGHVELSIPSNRFTPFQFFVQSLNL